jgi:hypothetical protein
LLVTPGAYPRRKHLKGAPIGLILALPSNSKTWQERVSKGKPSSLLGLAVSDEGKKFYNSDTRLELKMMLALVRKDAKKSSFRPTTGVNVIKLFFFVKDEEAI